MRHFSEVLGPNLCTAPEIFFFMLDKEFSSDKYLLYFVIISSEDMIAHDDSMMNKRLKL